jgi:hypothetical protein
VAGLRAPWPTMGELTGDRREGDGERRGAGGTAAGRRKGGKGAMGRGVLAVLRSE